MSGGGEEQKTFLYFAYGSNMLTQRIRINNPSARLKPNFKILYYFLSLIHHPTRQLNLMFDVYYRKTKAFRAIAPSSVVFQK